ncbi:hypothetical protein [Streptomyces rishiriensis]|uniref:Uncharacterized protein n=1 Tax=Streptomyces rishiriensis TaxID=68264 RepID=A0ABU0NZ53_STRRH|nr:hypothetical protein [Streptomyces rishiriensis]
MNARAPKARHLAHRARVRRLIAEHPAIAREPVERPVFVAASRPTGARPHRYDLSRYDLTRADVDSAFADCNALRAEVDRT